MNAHTSMKTDWFCPIACWTVAALGGLLTAVMLSTIGGLELIAVIFLGGIACVAGGLVLQRAMCIGADLPPVGAYTVPGGGATTRPAPAAPAEAGPEAKPEVRSEAQSEEKAEDDASGTVSATVQAVAENAGVVVGKAAGAVEKAATSVVAAVVSATPALKGEEDLRSRKGTWRYQGPTGKETDDQPGDAPGADYDGDGTTEGTDEGTKPQTLASAREGGGDNLKEIKGIGPKLEKLLNEMGFYHFDQIASWSEEEIAWVNANLEGFRGRVTRDDWVAQARVLASGGDTEFSRRVEEGDVY